MPTIQSKEAGRRIQISQLPKKEKDALFKRLQVTLTGMTAALAFMIPHNATIFAKVLTTYSAGEIGVLLARLAGMGSLLEFLLNP